MNSQAPELSPEEQTQLERLHNRRVLLRKQLRKNPHDGDLLKEYVASHKPRYIRLAARHGVFISYTPNDAVFTLDLNTDLRAAGVVTWMDELDAPHDADWRQAVDTALQQCGVMLLIMTPEAQRDPAVRQECERFLEMGKAVLPVMRRSASVEALGVRIAPIDFSRNYQRSLRVLLPLLRTRPERART